MWSLCEGKICELKEKSEISTKVVGLKSVSSQIEDDNIHHFCHLSLTSCSVRVAEGLAKEEVSRENEEQSV